MFFTKHIPIVFNKLLKLWQHFFVMFLLPIYLPVRAKESVAKRTPTLTNNY